MRKSKFSLEGWSVNKKRVRRLYRLRDLQLRMRVRRRKHIALHRGPTPVPAGPAERWRFGVSDGNRTEWTR